MNQSFFSLAFRSVPRFFALLLVTPLVFDDRNIAISPTKDISTPFGLQVVRP